MTSLLDSLSKSLTPETLGALGSSLGLDPNMLSQGMNVVGPLLQSGAAEAAAAPGGADMLGGLLNQLPDSMASDPMGSITSMLGGGAGLGGLLGGLMGGSGGAATSSAPDFAGALLGSSAAYNPLAGLINSGFGSGIGAIGKMLSKTLGFDVTPLIAAGLPLILGLLKKSAGDQKLDNAGIAQMLDAENRAFLNSGSPEAKMVQSALDVGKQARALRSNFQGDEWATVRNAPLAVASLITSASGTGGTPAELAALCDVVKELGDAADPVSVVGLCFEDGFSKEALELVTRGAPKSDSMAAIAAAIRLVTAKAPSEADAYKRLLLNVGENVASATKQGGFLGFGGKKIGDAEAAALRELEAALSIV